MRKLLVIAALALSGCNTYYPGDGHLVYVDVDPMFSTLMVKLDDGTSVNEAVLIGEGIRFWDVTGARLRTRWQLTDADTPDVASAPVLHIEYEEVGPDGATNGQYFAYPGIVKIYRQSYGLSAPAVREVAAHEVGHAMGLMHVTDSHAVMYQYTHESTGINDTDMIEFTRWWP